MYQAIPGVSSIGTTELIIIAVILIFLFGAKKLPEMARGSGRALRIFKAETKGMMDDKDDDADSTDQRSATTNPPQITQQPTDPTAPVDPATPPSASEVPPTRQQYGKN